MIMMYVDGKRTVFPMKLKLGGESFEKIYKKENFEKNVMDLIETNHQINITSGNSVSSNTSFKKHLNGKSFKLFWESWSRLCEARCLLQGWCVVAVSVASVMWTYKCDVISALRKNSKEPSSYIMSAEASFDHDNNKEALNVKKILSVIIANKMEYKCSMFKHYLPKYNRRCYGKYWRRTSILIDVLNVHHTF